MVSNADSNDDSLVLITRPLTEAQLLARSLRQEGYKVLIDPLLQIRPIECPFIDTRSVQAFVATSMNGIRRLAQLVSHRDIPLYTVGEISALEAEKMGFNQVYGAQGSITSLLQMMQENIDPKAGKILYFSGQEIKGDLVNILTQKNFDIERLIIYEALAAQSLQSETKEALITGRLKAILFFSPRTSEIFVNLSTMYAQVFKNIMVVCLSSEVALPLQKFQWQRILIAPERTGRSMVSLLTEMGTKQKEMF